MKINLQNTDFNHILELISNTQNNVFRVINQELVLLNWGIGKYVSKYKTIEKKQFYILFSAKEKLSFRELKRQIESSIFERTMLADIKVSTPLAQLQKGVSQIFKDIYLIADYETKLINKKLFQQKLHDLYLLFDQKSEKL